MQGRTRSGGEQVIKLLTINLWILLFADDVVLVCEDDEQLRRIFLRFDSFCKENELQISETKTQVMITRQADKKKKIDNTFSCGKYNFKVVDNFKYLGVHFNEIADPRFMINKQVEKSRKN